MAAGNDNINDVNSLTDSRRNSHESDDVYRHVIDVPDNSSPLKIEIKKLEREIDDELIKVSKLRSQHLIDGQKKTDPQENSLNSTYSSVPLMPEAFGPQIDLLDQLMQNLTEVTADSTDIPSRTSSTSTANSLNNEPAATSSPIHQQRPLEEENSSDAVIGGRQPSLLPAFNNARKEEANITLVPKSLSKPIKLTDLEQKYNSMFKNSDGSNATPPITIIEGADLKHKKLEFNFGASKPTATLELDDKEQVKGIRMQMTGSGTEKNRVLLESIRLFACGNPNVEVTLPLSLNNKGSNTNYSELAIQLFAYAKSADPEATLFVNNEFINIHEIMKDPNQKGIFEKSLNELGKKPAEYQPTTKKRGGPTP